MIVGATIGRPRSLRLQNKPPSIAKTKNIYLAPIIEKNNLPKI